MICRRHCALAALVAVLITSSTEASSGSEAPTSTPTAAPTASPTSTPTAAPTAAPTPAPFQSGTSLSSSGDHSGIQVSGGSESAPSESTSVPGAAPVSSSSFVVSSFVVSSQRQESTDVSSDDGVSSAGPPQVPSGSSSSSHPTAPSLPESSLAESESTNPTSDSSASIPGSAGASSTSLTDDSNAPLSVPSSVSSAPSSSMAEPSMASISGASSSAPSSDQSAVLSSAPSSSTLPSFSAESSALFSSAKTTEPSSTTSSAESSRQGLVGSSAPEASSTAMTESSSAAFSDAASRRSSRLGGSSSSERKPWIDSSSAAGLANETIEVAVILGRGVTVPRFQGSLAIAMEIVVEAIEILKASKPPPSDPTHPINVTFTFVSIENKTDPNAPPVASSTAMSQAFLDLPETTIKATGIDTVVSVSAAPAVPPAPPPKNNNARFLSLPIPAAICIGVAIVLVIVGAVVGVAFCACRGLCCFKGGAVAGQSERGPQFDAYMGVVQRHGGRVEQTETFVMPPGRVLPVGPDSGGGPMSASLRYQVGDAGVLHRNVLEINHTDDDDEVEEVPVESIVPPMPHHESPALMIEPHVPVSVSPRHSPATAARPPGQWSHETLSSAATTVPAQVAADGSSNDSTHPPFVLSVPVMLLKESEE